MGYDINASTSNCYEGTTCLINKLGITDESKLKEFEGAVTFAKASELEKNPISTAFDIEHYRAIHKYLFEDIYDWAGEYRTVNLSKKGTKFAPADKISDLMTSCFTRLKENDFFQGNSFDVFVENIVDFYCVTNMIHPFREGNGRTQRIFITQLIRYNDYDIDFSSIDKDELMIATIQSANGVTDYLKNIFHNSIKG
ncbi:MAG: Fic/DOC family protein [Eubacterium sp.]